MNTALWIVQVLLALMFLLAGGMKLVLPMEKMTGSVALPEMFLRLIGVVEVLGGIGLILPWLLRIQRILTPLAAAGLVIVMIGATVINLMGSDGAGALVAAVVGALAAFVAWGRVATQPSAFRIARTVTIAAPASAVFAEVNDFHRWEAWSPWAKLDPAMTQTYGGAAAGAGAVYAWAGDREVGEGRMTMTDSRPHELIRIRLEFLKPLAATHTAEFTFTPEGNQTAVTWSMAGTNRFMAKAIGLVMNMDTMIGGRFDQGLAQMKAIVETAGR